MKEERNCLEKLKLIVYLTKIQDHENIFMRERRCQQFNYIMNISDSVFNYGMLTSKVTH